MIEELKKRLYFLIAWYFRFFAQIRLSRWQPRIIVVTGSSGKTTLMHFIESQLRDVAKCSHHANSALGIPFDILGLERKTLTASEWPGLFLKAPFQAFSPATTKKIYVAECDCDRPGEGQFLAEFLKPEVTLWISLSRTHSENFDDLVGEKKFETVEEAIAHEYGYFIRHSDKLVIISGDSQLIKNQAKRIHANVVEITEANYLQQHTITSSGTEFIIGDQNFSFNSLQPKEIFYAIAMTMELCHYLQIQPDSSFKHLVVPTGRSSVYKGVKSTTLVDSSYNANLSSMIVILKMFEQFQAEKKWVVLGDMKELGKEAQEEHERLAEIVSTIHLYKILLLGPLITKYTFPKVKELLRGSDNVIAFDTHGELLKFLEDNIQGEETILFKASQSLVFDGFIQHLLLDPQDIPKLPRRELFWEGYRRERGL
ncbi:MAG: Mur ligase family protein [bacterium]|nr:Mur ligase family protein [bacterium]